MRLPKVFGTSSFRLALVYAGLTGITFVLLFGVIFWSTARFMRHQIDDLVANELSEVLSDAGGGGALGIQSLVQGMARHASGFYYLFQDSQGGVLAIIDIVLEVYRPAAEERQQRLDEIVQHGLLTAGDNATLTLSDNSPGLRVTVSLGTVQLAGT